MGRTLHFSFQNSQTVTDEQWREIYDIGKQYNKNFRWTCENMYLNRYGCYPNWEQDCNWDTVEKRGHELELKQLHPVDTAKQLIDEGIALPFRDTSEDYTGFVKVTGNEYNAALVYLCLLDVSHVIPSHLIKLFDEGKLLLCPVVIKNGKVKPDTKEVQAHLEYLDREAIDDELKQEIRQYKEFLNIKTFSSPALFCRAVDPKDFEDYPEFQTVVLGTGKGKGTPSQVMAGFHGEYYNLTDKDPEIESYKMMKAIQEFVKNHLPENVDKQISKTKLSTRSSKRI